MKRDSGTRDERIGDPPEYPGRGTTYAEVYRTFLITHVSGERAEKIGLLLILGEQRQPTNTKSQRKKKKRKEKRRNQILRKVSLINFIHVLLLLLFLFLYSQISHDKTCMIYFTTFFQSISFFANGITDVTLF